MGFTHSLGKFRVVRFEYRGRHTRQQLRLLLGRGAISLAIGFTFLVVCLLLRQLLAGINTSGITILSEGLLILGWVAMWKPVEVFLYDWWPELGKQRLFDRIAHMEIETRSPDSASRLLARGSATAVA